MSVLLNKTFNVDNKVIFLTGAAGLFGQQLSECFLSNGAKVILCIHSEEKIEKVRNILSRNYNDDQYLLLRFESTDSNSIEECAKKCIEKYNSIDVLINNASIDATFSNNKIDTLNKNSFENYPIELIKKICRC